MKFLCVSCDEQMKLETTESDPRGSLSILYGCPTCGTRVSMMTNPAETQVVSSMGVKIGASKEADSLSNCPFGDVVREMGVETSESGVGWTREALDRLENIPDFVRPMARQGIEHYAKSKGYQEVDEAVLEEARGQFGM